MRGPLTILLLVYAAGIFFLHATPTGFLELNAPVFGPVRASHLLHVAMFIPWGYLGLPYVQRCPIGCLRRGAAWVSLGLVFAATAEVMQYFLPHRSFTLTDLLFNATGVLLGSLALIIWRRRRSSPGLSHPRGIYARRRIS